MSLLLSLALVATAAAPANPPVDWSARLTDAIARAIAQNPEVVSMEARIEASHQRVLQANALPDPEVELGFKDVPVSNPSRLPGTRLGLLDRHQGFPRKVRRRIGFGLSACCNSRMARSASATSRRSCSTSSSASFKPLL